MEIIVLLGLYFLIKGIIFLFGTTAKIILIAIGTMVVMSIGRFILLKEGIADKDSVIGYIFFIFFIFLLFIWLIAFVSLSIIKKINLKRPLINEKYGRCKNCMSPDIFLVEIYDKRVDNKIVFRYKCNDCFESFTNYERDGES